jgi:hypothetical protein
MCKIDRVANHDSRLGTSVTPEVGFRDPRSKHYRLPISGIIHCLMLMSRGRLRSDRGSSGRAQDAVMTKF